MQASYLTVAFWSCLILANVVENKVMAGVYVVMAIIALLSDMYNRK